MNSNAALPAPDLLARVRAFLEAYALTATPLLVGVSGGLDSITLLRVLAELDLPLYASHIHYGLRGYESDADAAFVAALCDELRIPHEVFHAPAAPSRGKQDWARKVRYERWLYLAETQECSAVGVAHHAEDQVETILLNATRGAGLRGLGGMKPVRPWSSSQDGPLLIRPLLDVSRAEIHAYALERGWRWREDASNATTELYRRNALRHRVVQPLADWAGAGGMRNLVHTLKRVQDLEDALHMLLPTLEDNRVQISALDALPDALRRHALRELFRAAFPKSRADERLVLRLEALLHQQPGRKVMAPEGEVRRLRDALWFVPASSGGKERLEKTTLQLGMTIETGAGRLEVRESGPEGCPILRHEEPAWVRSWKPGDRFVPPGRSREVRVSDVLTKSKVPLDLKPCWPVVGVGERIGWVPGAQENAIQIAQQNEPSLYLSFYPVRS